MKKLISMLTALLLVFLAGCSSTKEQTKTFTKVQNGISMELTYYYTGDKVTKQTATNTMEYSKLGVTKEQLKKAIDPVLEKYKGVEGLEDTVDYQSDKAIEKLVVDYTKANLKELKNIPGINAEEGDGVSLKKSEELLLKQGFTEKK